jgi:hypothetical protein
MSWVRLEAAIYSDAKMIRAGFWGGQVFLAALTMAKLRGWRGGVIPKDDFDPDLVARHVNAVTVPGVTESLAEGIAACVRVGLFTDAGTHYEIKRWGKYQVDPSAAERKQRQRDREDQGSPVTDVTVRHGCHDDGTGRTGQDIESPPTPLRGAGGPSLRPDEPPTEGQAQGALAVCSVILAAKDAAKERRDDARRIRDAIKAGTATRKTITDFATRHMADTACRVAYLGTAKMTG